MKFYYCWRPLDKLALPTTWKNPLFSHWKKSLRLLCVWDDCLSIEKFYPCGWATLLGDINVCLRPAMSNPNGLLSQTLCHCLGQSRTLNNMLLRAAHWMAYFDRNKLNYLSKCTESIRILTAVVTDVIKWHRGRPALKCQIQNYQNKYRFSACRILLLQRIFKLGSTKLSTGQHAARGLDIAVLDEGLSQLCRIMWLRLSPAGATFLQSFATP